jgi:hypothetical protein
MSDQRGTTQTTQRSEANEPRVEQERIGLHDEAQTIRRDRIR